MQFSVLAYKYAKLLSRTQYVHTGAALGAMSDDLVIERRGPVLTVAINRPTSANAFTLDLLSRLWSTWDAFERDPHLRVAILTGSERVFCAGRDLRELRAADDADGLVALRPPSAPATWLPRLLPSTTKL